MKQNHRSKNGRNGLFSTIDLEKLYPNIYTKFVMLFNMDEYTLFSCMKPDSIFNTLSESSSFSIVFSSRFQKVGYDLKPFFINLRREHQQID
jgi:hypothetical protein